MGKHQRLPHIRRPHRQRHCMQALIAFSQRVTTIAASPPRLFDKSFGNALTIDIYADCRRHSRRAKLGDFGHFLFRAKLYRAARALILIAPSPHDAIDFIP